MPKILLADDSTHAQRMGAKILSAEGFEVTTVGNGQAAIQSLKQSVPDLIVADIFMPGRNGYEVCQFIKKDATYRHIPVLLIIGAMEPYDPEEGKRAGADGLITKPLESSNLVSTVRDLLTAAARKFPERQAQPPAPEPKMAAKSPSSSSEWGSSEMQEFTTSAAPSKLDIPEEVSQQPVGMFTDLLNAEPGSTPVPGTSISSEPASMQAVEPSPPPAADPLFEPARSFAAPGFDVAPQPKVVWTAEPAVVTAEEEKLFEQPTGNWGDLTQMVSESDEAAERLLTGAPSGRSPAEPVAPAAAPIESFEVIASPADRGAAWPQSGAGSDSQSSDDTPMLEELEVAEAGGTFAPASMFSSGGKSGEAPTGTISSPFAAVIPMPSEVSAPAQKTSGASSSELMDVSLGSDAQAAADEAAVFQAAPKIPSDAAPAEQSAAEPPPASVSMAEPAAASAEAAPPATEPQASMAAATAPAQAETAAAEPDPELVERRVRERLEALMPEIIEQVKKSLKP